MQTFLPYSNFRESAMVLDRQRLGKQRVEAKQILLALTGQSKGWVNHPATRMWRGHTSALALYGRLMCLEWRIRGYVDNLDPFFSEHYDLATLTLPAWLGDPDFHASHRSNLLRKDLAYYSQFGWSESTDLPYIWPVG